MMFKARLQPWSFVLFSITLQFDSILPQATDGNGVTNDSLCPPVVVSEDQLSTTCQQAQVYKGSECDGRICGNDKMCLQYHDLANNLQYHPYLKYRNVTHMTLERTSRNVDYNASDAYVNKTLDCGEFTELPTKLVNNSGFSPWKYVINRDENRIPRDILETYCVCQRCFDGSRTEISNLYYTQPVMVTRYFHMKGNGTVVFNAKFSYGCTCVFM